MRKSRLTKVNKMVLEDYGLEQADDSNAVYGQVGGESLFFRAPSRQKLRLCAEPFIAAMLLPAMQSGATIEIPEGLQASAEFLNNIAYLQDIFCAWYPTLRKVDIDAHTRSEPFADQSDGVALFFSGGIDANYSLLKHNAALTHLVYVRGIDLQLEGDELWEQCCGRNQKIAEHFGKPLVQLESNVRFFVRNKSNQQIGWTMAQGCGLASIAHVLGFPRNIISSSNTFRNLHPLGSHPLTDPLFSSDQVTIVHDGCEASRHEKLIAISNEASMLANLRVCWQDKGFNCGHCDKCLHLRTALYLLGLEAGGLKPLTDFSELSSAHTGTKGEYVEWEDNLDFALEVGDRKAINALRKLLRRYKRRQLLKLIDELYLDGVGKGFKSRFE